jgi:hypothetical protein
MGSVQTSNEWGRRASIVIPPADVELGAFREPKEVNVVSSFSDDESSLAHRPGTVMSTLGRLGD